MQLREWPLSPDSLASYEKSPSLVKAFRKLSAAGNKLVSLQADSGGKSLLRGDVVLRHCVPYSYEHSQSRRARACIDGPFPMVGLADGRNDSLRGLLDGRGSLLADHSIDD